MLIDWSKLEAYKTKKSKSFEQLCYQIAVRLYSSRGKFTSIDDSGGGDGVEFYLTLDNGKQWGWQAKYYEGSVRLNISGRKQKIIDSLEKAIKVHPELEVWYLCVPMDLTPDEEIWIDNVLVNHIPSDREIKIEIWRESIVHEMINQPKLNGIKQAFFNSLELSSAWFEKTFDNSFLSVRSKFDDLLYAPNEEFEYWHINPVLCNSSFVEKRIAHYPIYLRKLYNDILKKLDELKYTNNLWRPLFEECLKQYREVNENIDKVLLSIDLRTDYVNPNEINKISRDDYKAEIDYYNEHREHTSNYVRTWIKENIVVESEEEKRNKSEQSRKIWPIESAYEKFFEELRYYVRDSCLPNKWRVAHCLGNGGDGKTNLSVALAKQYLKEKHPAIYIPAIKFTSSTSLSDQMLSLLDIRSNYSFDDFLDCLNELGIVYNQRVPIILDGLNEALNEQGFLNGRLHLDILPIENEILRRTNLVFITTCRTSYQQEIWGNVSHYDRRFCTLYGFTNYSNKKNLVRTYFNHYKIQADLSFLSLGRFTKPLYLKIFCEATNPYRRNLVQVTLGYDSIYLIFDEFVEHCNNNIHNRIKRIGIPPTNKTKTVASRVLCEIARHLWENPQRAFPLQELIQIADENNVTNYNLSISKAILDEELLLLRNWVDNEEAVFITYDLLAGYFIAKYLIDVTTDYRDLFRKDKLELLIGDDFEKLHPNHEDVLDCLCSLLPIKKSVFVHDLLTEIDNENQSIYNENLIEKSLKSTILLSPEYIPNRQIDLIDGISKEPENLIWLIGLSEDVMFVSNHPFNFSFWSERLVKLDMNVRDSSWSEYLRNLEEDFLQNIIVEFESLQEYPSLTQEQATKINLVADFLKWTFTTTNKNLKIRSSDALYQFAIRFPETFIHSYYKSAEINDPTVFEWMNILLYNALITILRKSSNTHRETLEDLTIFLANEVLSIHGRFSTNHLVSRSYAFDSLKLLVRKVSQLKQEIDLKSIQDNFKHLGVTEWQESEDLNENEYSDGNSLIDYFFNKEMMPYIIEGRGNEYNRTPEYLSKQANLRWRAYQLGYRFNLFGRIDKDIAKYKHFGDYYAAIERYADKYLEIAFLEYCGYLKSLDKLKDHFDLGYLRTFKPKHDPKEDLDKTATKNRYLDTNYINFQIPLKEWCNDHSIPNIDKYLNINNSMGKTGSFVLLHSLVHQHAKKAERQIFFRVDTIFVKKNTIKTARQALQSIKIRGLYNDSTPSTQHIHDSEIPDAEIIPNNEFLVWNYTSGSKEVRRKYTNIELLRDGKPIEDKEADSLWKIVSDSLNYITNPRESSSSFPSIRISHPEEDSIEGVFKQMGIELKEVETIKVEEQAIDKELKIFIPVRYLKNKAYLCRNVIDYFKLSRDVDSTDLYDINGDLSSFNHTFYVEYVDQEAFTYIRKDLLDKYLKENKLVMFTLIWGERDYYPHDGDWSRDTKKIQSRAWAEFSDVIEYKL